MASLRFPGPARPAAPAKARGKLSHPAWQIPACQLLPGPARQYRGAPHLAKAGKKLWAGAYPACQAGPESSRPQTPPWNALWIEAESGFQSSLCQPQTIAQPRLVPGPCSSLWKNQC